MVPRPPPPASGTVVMPILQRLLLFGFFVIGLCPAPLAELLELYLARDKLSVLASPIVDARAFRAGEPE